jgi:hypothetical protein
MTLRFLIIVPHGYCDSKVEVRHCDRRALEEANKLKALIKSKGYNVDFFIADRYRAEIDYNRKPARNSELRNAIRSKLKEYKNDRTIIFEMHSFPDNYSDEGYDFKDARVAFLSIPKYEEDMYFLTDYVQKKTGFEIVPQRGINTNDVQWDTSVMDNIHHYLIESRENKKDYPEEDSDMIIPYILEGALKRLEITGGGFIIAALPKALYITSIFKHFEYVILILLILFIFYVIEHTTEFRPVSYFESLL